jgi:GTPase SAR1 family protein
LVQHPPTNKVWSQELSIGKVTFQAYDIGGHLAARRVWRDYFPAIDGIVFIVDASDIDRLSEARDELIVSYLKFITKMYKRFKLQFSIDIADVLQYVK